MFPVTITIHNNDQLAAVLHALGNYPAPAAPVGTPPTAKTEKEVKKPDPKPEPAAASAAPPAATEKATPAPTAATSGGDATIDKAKALTMKIVADKGRDTAVELLKKYGVPVAAKLPADQVAAFCTDAEAVLAS